MPGRHFEIVKLGREAVDAQHDVKQVARRLRHRNRVSESRLLGWLRPCLRFCGVQRNGRQYGKQVRRNAKSRTVHAFASRTRSEIIFTVRWAESAAPSCQVSRWLQNSPAK